MNICLIVESPQLSCVPLKTWILILASVGILGLCSRLQAYPAYIAYGYASCRTCHLNPMGNGLLNRYGRAVQATEIAGNLFQQDSEERANRSGFFLGPVPEWMDVQLSYRGLYSKRWITMQAEGAAAVTFSKKLMLVASGGYVPLPQSLSAAEKQRLGNLISREHYVAFTPRKGLGIYVGLMDVAFGLRVPDHNAYIRSTQYLNMNDQVHGILLHRDWALGQLALHVFMGKFQQEPATRQKGASLSAEFEVAENRRLGGSLLATQSDYRFREMAAIHGRAKIGLGSSILAQLGLQRQKLAGTDDRSIESTSLIQSRHWITSGLFALATFEHLTGTLRGNRTTQLRFGPSLEYLPVSKLELRLDFLRSVFSGGSSNTPTYTFQLQTHAWL